MKYIFSAIVVLSLCSFTFFEGIYNFPLKTIDGKPLKLSEYQGKKLLFVIISGNASDTSVTSTELASLATKYSGSLVILAIPADEAGFKKEDMQRLRSLSQAASSNLIVTENIKVKKSSGAQQSLLFQWLTNKDRNGHFDTDVQGVGHKFFVDEKGMLYAVINAGTKLSNPVIDKILSKGVKR
jgi:glutathione peroxidase